MKCPAPVVVLLLLGAVLAAGKNADDSISTSQARTPDAFVDVVVVGGGMSGLSAARSLMARGYSVAVLEARPRVGGRSFREQITSARAPLWIDEGGQWVGPDQKLFLKLIKEMGLQLYESYHGAGTIVVKYRNQSSVSEGACWDCMTFPTENSSESPKPLIAAADAATGEMRAGLKELIRVMKVFTDLAATVNVDKPWLTPNAEELDAMTFKDWVRNTTTNPLARVMMIIAGSELGAIAEPWWSSALHTARQQACAPQVETPEKWLIKGAAGQIPLLLAQNITRAGGKILLNSPGLLIEQNKTGVIVHSHKKSVAAQAVIVAMPPHLTGRIDYDPPLEPLREQLVQRVPMGSIIKALAVYDTPFWRKNPATNHSFVFDPEAKGATQMAYDISQPMDVGGGGSGVLATFVTRNSTMWFDRSDDDIKAAVLASFAEFYGPQALKPTAFVAKNWAREPFTGGAYSAFMPLGAWTTFGTAWTRPHGRVFWAGTEVSNRWPGFYEGALHAANVAVDGVAGVTRPTGKYEGSFPAYKQAKEGGHHRLRRAGRRLLRFFF